jgi:hypothetical protein
VTILPDKFVKPEQMASEIIRKTGFHQALNAINVVYFDLDTVAIHGRISSLSSCTTYGASAAPVSAGLFFK